MGNDLQEPLNGTFSLRSEGVPSFFRTTDISEKAEDAGPAAARDTAADTHVATQGFTLIELMIVIAIVGILASVAIPWLMQARMAAHESSAVASLRAINDAQASYQAACGRGWYAAALTGLGKPMPTTGVAFISPDLSTSDVVQKSGYTISMRTATEEKRPGCNEAQTAPGYHVLADPIRPGYTGNRHFASNSSGVIYQHSGSLEGKIQDEGVPGTGVELK